MFDQLSFDESEDVQRLRAAWGGVYRQATLNIGTSMVERFFASIVPLSVESGTVVLQVPSSFNAEWLRRNHGPDLTTLLSDALLESVRVEFRVSPEAGKVSTKRMDAAPTITPRVAPVISDQAAANGFEPNSAYSFDSYVSGPSNRLALAGAKAVAAEPGRKFNPLFIYGPSGLGKTHLMHAVATEIRRWDPNYPVVYITAQQFTEDFISSLHGGKVDQFRRAQRNTGLWLVDDIQFVAGKERTQEEIFYIFNHLYQAGRQIVLCSDRPPRELLLMQERLRSRFESGLVADIQHPDIETKCAIALSKANRFGLPLAHDVALYLAEHVPGDVRVLEGALQKLYVKASLYGGEVSVALASELVEEDFAGIIVSTPKAEQIIKVVGEHLNVPVAEILSESRKAAIAHARHVAVYITREMTQGSWKTIGGQFGGKDHTSMIHAHRKIQLMIDKDKGFAGQVKMLMRNINPNFK